MKKYTIKNLKAFCLENELEALLNLNQYHQDSLFSYIIKQAKNNYYLHLDDYMLDYISEAGLTDDNDAINWIYGLGSFQSNDDKIKILSYIKGAVDTYYFDDHDSEAIFQNAFYLQYKDKIENELKNLSNFININF